MSQRGIDAADEKGPVAVAVWCATCDTNTREPLGVVRRSTAGLVFEARLPATGTVWPPGLRDELRDHFRDRGAKWLEVDVAAARCIALLEDDTERETPAVECRGHRVDLDRLELLAAANAQTNVRRPTNLQIHHPPISAG